MKVYIPHVKESWIIDRLVSEWYEYNIENSSKFLRNSDVVWNISPWAIKTTKKFYKNKKYIVSIYHFEDKDLTKENLEIFYSRDKFVDGYHVISLKSKEILQELTKKPIKFIPFWVNQNNFFEINNKDLLKQKFNLRKDKFLIGSFQRDTEGRDLKSPKLIKGPDIFIEIAEKLFKKNKNLLVVLAGKRRQFVIAELEKKGIPYKYFEMVNINTLNELYNTLDLYIVSSRVEGGPQAIVECGITKTPILSTDVGIAAEFLSEESIYNLDNFELKRPNVEYAYQKAKNITIPKGFDDFINFFKEL